MSDASASRRDPLELALRSLAPRERSRRDLDGRLAKAGFDEPARAAALDELERLGYLDDCRFAAARAESLAGRGYGDAWIREELAQHGVAPDVAAEALDGLAPEAERAARLAAGEEPGPRLAARLGRKGFGAEAIETALGTEFADPADAA